LVELMREAWVLSSVEFGAPRVRSGHLLCALLSEESLSRLAREASQELQKLSPEALRKDLPTLTANTEESQGEVADVRAAAAAAPPAQDAGPRPVHHRPDAAGQGGQDRPRARPRRRDPPGHRHPYAPPPEQPDPDRRGRRRQDRRRRGLRPARGRRRRAGSL